MKLTEIKASNLDEIDNFCRQYNINEWSIENGFINSKKDIFLNGYDKTVLPFPFGNVKGSFWINNSSITTLKNCPTWVDGTFGCSANQNLTSLEFSPKIVMKNYECSINQGLTSLKGISPEIHGWVNACTCNNLISAEGIVTAEEGLYIKKCEKFTKLLRLFEIENLKSVYVGIKELDDIMTEFLSMTGDREDAMIKCRQALRGAGFIKYARL